MTEGIIIAIVSGICSTVASVTGAVLVFISSNKKLKAEQEETYKKQIKEQNDKIDKAFSDISKKLEAHKEEYIKEINDIHDNLSKLRSDNEHHQDIVKLEIQNLSERVEKHNQVIERTYEAEKAIGILNAKVEAIENH